ncbi:MAG: type IVB secretion system protein IcmH/DotU [Proteobacteria bacterium]|nr:type IVB secretion system protein IcmH/DotU [Pseudomonadota bacterium]RTL36202.1 MAG: DotU family type IV/VI secretion system protein [Rhodocyclaceae bacterium]
MSSIPSLFAEAAQPTTYNQPVSGTHTLVDLLYDGFHLLILLRMGCLPKDESKFSSTLQELLGTFEHKARKLNFSNNDIVDTQYAFCAVVDEFILSTQNQIRETWERRPLQLLLFGEQLAGEHFFDKLEQARNSGAQRIAALEVFHMCLLIGFKGRYVLEGPEKLQYLISQLGDQIRHIKGKPAGFAPNWARPDNIINSIRQEIPTWIVASALALCGLLAYAGLLFLGQDTVSSSLSAYANVIEPPQRSPTLTVILP